MSRLVAYLHRRFSDRKRTNAIVSLANWAAVASRRRILRQSQTIALEAKSFESYYTSIHPAQVASFEALLAEPTRTACVWTPAVSPPVLDHSRIIAIDGVKQPWFAVTAPIYHPTQQGFLRVPSAIVYPRPGLVMPEPGVVLRNDLLRWVPDHRLTPGFFDFVDGKLVAQRSELHPRGRIRRTVLVLCHAFHRNYGHWLFDCLPFLLPWHELAQQGRLAVLVPPLADWQRRTLELLGVPASAVIEAAQPSIFCDDVIVPGLNSTSVETVTQPNSYFLHQPGPSVIDSIRILKAGIHAVGPIHRLERIYVSRHGIESFRYLRNEDEVEAVMMQLGFTVVRPQELTFDEQVATFACARVIAGPHGAGLTNASFAPAGCLVVDICPDVWASRWMVRLTQLFEHQYLPLAYPSNAELPKPLFADASIGQTFFYAVQIDESLP